GLKAGSIHRNESSGIAALLKLGVVRFRDGLPESGHLCLQPFAAAYRKRLKEGRLPITPGGQLFAPNEQGEKTIREVTPCAASGKTLNTPHAPCMRPRGSRWSR